MTQNTTYTVINEPVDARLLLLGAAFSGQGHYTIFVRTLLSNVQYAVHDDSVWIEDAEVLAGKGVVREPYADFGMDSHNHLHPQDRLEFVKANAKAVFPQLKEEDLDMSRKWFGVQE